MKKFFFIAWLIIFPITVFAAIPVWEIVPNESKITFTATQNNSPVNGEFKKFSGEITGDLNQLQDSNVIITVDTSSIATSYKDLEDTLKTADWFNIELFPKAVFQANKFKKIGADTYQADGKLTIKNKTQPLLVKLTVDSYDKTKAKISGFTKIRRNDFGIGSGEWVNTDEIKDDVKINFIITAVKK